MDKKFNISKFIGYGVFAIMIIAILVIRFTYGSVVAVSGTSMYPTFDSGDFVFGTVVHDDTEINTGDIVVVKQDGKLLIKRVHALPGEHIMPDYVKGIPEQTLTDDEYYVVGDNWKNSRDSRMFGPVTRDNIVFKYADIHWTRLTLIISLVVPAILFIAQMTIVFIPADKKKKVPAAETTEAPADGAEESVSIEPTQQFDTTKDVVTESITNTSIDENVQENVANETVSN